MYVVINSMLINVVEINIIYLYLQFLMVDLAFYVLFVIQFRIKFYKLTAPILKGLCADTIFLPKLVLREKSS